MPSKWIKKYNIKKGDELDITELGNKLLISTENSQLVEPVSIDLTGIRENLIRRMIISLYINGYDDIRVKHNNLPAVQLTVNSCMGYAILEQQSDSCLIKNIASTANVTFDSIFRQAFRLLISVSEDCSNLANLNNSFEKIKESTEPLIIFSNYCLRYLNKSGYKDAIKTNIYYHLTHNLKRIGELYAQIIKYGCNHKLTKNEIGLLTKTSEHIKKLYGLSFNFDFNNAKKYYDESMDFLNTYKSDSKKIENYLLEIIKNCSQFIPNLLTANINSFKGFSETNLG